MKTVVVQSLYGIGVMGNDPSDKRDLFYIEKYCIPSVRRYAERHGYSYILHRPTKPHFQFAARQAQKSTDKKETARRGYLIKATNLETPPNVMPFDQFDSLFEPYYVMNELAALYERFVYLDVDIFITENAPAIPHTKGVWAYHEHHMPHEHTVALGFPDVPHSHQFNSGVLLMGRKEVQSFYHYLKTTPPDARCASDQDYFRLWSLKNKVHKLSSEWNYMVFRGNQDKRGYVIHYIDKSALQRELPSFSIRMLLFPYRALKKIEALLRRTPPYKVLRALRKKHRAA